eukprot:1327347-Amphidinium_carterae.1
MGLVGFPWKYREQVDWLRPSIAAHAEVKRIASQRTSKLSRDLGELFLPSATMPSFESFLLESFYCSKYIVGRSS